MVRSYNSFLVRCWRFEKGERRVMVEHIQSGEKERVDSLEAAVAWMNVWSGETPDGLLGKGDEEEPAEDGVTGKRTAGIVERGIAR